MPCSPQDIAAEFWAGRGRERKQRLITVDGFQVLRENNYTLNEVRPCTQVHDCIGACSGTREHCRSCRGAGLAAICSCACRLFRVCCDSVLGLSQGEPSVYGRETARPAEGGYKKRGRQVAGKDYTHSDLCQARMLALMG